MPRSTFLIAYVVAIALALGIQWLLGSVSGIVFLALCGLFYLVRHQRHHQQTLKWSAQPTAAPPPDLGSYDEIVTPIYKYVRSRQNEYVALRELTNNVLSAAQALPAAAVTLDKSFQIEWCNAQSQRLLDLLYEKDKGYNIFNIIRLPEFFDYAQSRQWSRPLRTRREIGGQVCSLQFQLTQHSNEGYLLLCQDITQLEKLQTTQRDFVANVSHEIRTPLTVLIGFLETLRDLPHEALTKEQRKQYEELMHEQAQRMLAIVADLLTLSTLESTEIVDGTIVQLAPIIDKAAVQAQSISRESHAFEFSVDPALAVVGQMNELSSAVTNLLTNAVRYTPEGGKITIRWDRNDHGEAIFSVTDTGLGIEKKDIPRITERFYRVDKSRSRASGGTGLGLAITKHIVIRHNAKLVVDSEINKGSTFKIVFPAEAVVYEQRDNSAETAEVAGA
ncbi:phosphate regulon sensor histidine kinase PhoR [Advenella mimigardefordensis]|uniref:histidine kinase n=1 Tax=Advenella mimigardefordensis (strain DSM 17166 / LMG 22922 / DPN7) TaxID=1247726 RepID=W0PC94_ADVMD|nr:phosphate regulon sensor histidine kinase PhoR [Advenella mimigardefordensis]AHG62668.1 phosphate regulon sensor protein PhoR [Advenella mimigardefordensis DPN7]